jgi:hypothetical protein
MPNTTTHASAGLASEISPSPAEALNEVDGLPPPVALLQMMTGYWLSQALYVVAKLGIADLLATGAMSVEALAKQTKTDASSLRRVLRALASSGVFTQSSPGSYALTPLATLLRSGTPDSMRALAIMYNEEQYRSWSGLLYSVQTGKPAFDDQFGMPIFEYLAKNPDADRIFNEAMTGWTNRLVEAVLDTYDFRPFHTVVDVGGSYGTLLTGILHTNPTLTGILFDQPHVVAAAADSLAAAGVADRCQSVGGDFFVDIPTGGDAYVLASILHDWDDEQCLSILAQCRRALPEHGKLLVIELVLPPGEEADLGKWLDLHMLVLAGGAERTAAAYEDLLRQAGFAVTRLLPTKAGPSIIEALPA